MEPINGCFDGLQSAALVLDLPLVAFLELFKMLGPGCLLVRFALIKTLPSLSWNEKIRLDHRLSVRISRKRRRKNCLVTGDVRVLGDFRSGRAFTQLYGVVTRNAIDWKSIDQNCCFCDDIRARIPAAFSLSTTGLIPICSWFYQSFQFLNKREVSRCLYDLYDARYDYYRGRQQANNPTDYISPFRIDVIAIGCWLIFHPIE